MSESYSILYLCGRYNIDPRSISKMSYSEFAELLKGRQDAEFELARYIALPGVLAVNAWVKKTVKVDDVIKRAGDKRSEMTPATPQQALQMLQTYEAERAEKNG